MNCEEAGELMFEADLADLRMERGTPLSEHLRECADCRERAGIILGTESTFAAALDALKPTRSFEEAVVTAVSARPEGGRKRFRSLPVLLPLAAAATIFFLLFPLWNRVSDIDREPVTSAFFAEMPEVQAPAEKTAMILDSDDPDFQIIWLF